MTRVFTFQADKTPSLLDDFDPFSSLTSPSQAADDSLDPFAVPAAAPAPQSANAAASDFLAFNSNDDPFNIAQSTDTPSSTAQPADDPVNLTQTSHDPFSISTSNDDDPFNINQAPASTAAPTAAAAAADLDPFGLGFASEQPAAVTSPSPAAASDPFAASAPESEQRALEAQFDVLMADDSAPAADASTANGVTDEVSLPFSNPTTAPFKRTCINVSIFKHLKFSTCPETEGLHFSALCVLFVLVCDSVPVGRSSSPCKTLTL